MFRLFYLRASLTPGGLIICYISVIQQLVPIVARVIPLAIALHNFLANGSNCRNLDYAMVFINGHEIITEEEKRLKEDREEVKYWKRWGPYVSERQWATDTPIDQRSFEVACVVREDYSDYLKERLFGLSNPQGNHGESVKEAYFYLDNTPTHSYMKYLYKYPQKKFPYEDLIEESAHRGRRDREYNLLDTAVFEQNRYWDIFIETAKNATDPEDLYFRVIAYNRGPEPAPLHIVPQICFRNTWKWGIPNPSNADRPYIRKIGDLSVETHHWKHGTRYIELAPSPPITDDGENIAPRMLFTENETNNQRLWEQPNKHKYVKDGFHRHIVDEEEDAVNPENKGTKFAAWYAFDEGDGVPPGDCAVVRFRLSKSHITPMEEEMLDNTIEDRAAEAADFYHYISPLPKSDDLQKIQRQAFAGMLWNKQHYHFIWDQWMKGDPNEPAPPPARKNVRNGQWKHMYLDSVLSMPDKWEYPFFAAWDTAFHCIPLAMIDPDFAKNQLDLLTREWYMHPNGQLPAYEWDFSDVNPPVHAWATFRVFKIERKMYCRQDLDFLERVFQKLLLNFTWWVNRKDFDGKGVFEGGFLGLDNIGLFNRSEPLPTGGTLEQADSTGWMAFYCLCMLNISLELAKHRRIYEDSKFTPVDLSVETLTDSCPI
ncbi:hypothetical protein KEM54_006814 [Ascosphaera aggregata]|nr:hypothetical protein KEM54_006814 [Ascosphaera aggregata]